jgi:hypothetical protein
MATGSDGPDAVEFATTLGYELDDFQVWCICGILSTNETARLCVTIALLIMPRQNGKNVILEVIELYCFFVLGWFAILHTAHLDDTTTAHMERLQSVIEADEELNAISKFYTGSGKNRLKRLDTGAEIRFMTRTKKRGRGRSPRLIVFDEALVLDDEGMAATVPSVSAQSMRPDPPLMIFTSSAPEEYSEVLLRLRDAAAAGSSPSMWMAEWSSKPGINIADVAEWYSNNPALGMRISEDFIRESEFLVLSAAKFGTERLGIVPDNINRELVPAATWALACNPKAKASGRLVYAVEISQDRDWSALAVGGSNGHVELGQYEPGTNWVKARLISLCIRSGAPAAIDPRGPAGALIGDLQSAGVVVLELNGQSVMEACGNFYDALADAPKDLTIRTHGALDSAVKAATRQQVGDVWRWGRRGEVDTSPLMAITLAWAAARTQGVTTLW